MRRTATVRLIAGLLAMQLLYPGSALAATDDGTYQEGVRLFQQQQYQQAVDKLTDVTAQHPERAEPYYYLGLAYYSLQLYDAAMEALQRARSLEPKLEPDVDYSLAAIYYQQGRIDQARELFGQLSARSDRPELAARAKEFLVAMDNAAPGQTVDPHLQAAIDAYQRKDYELARRELDLALQAQPESVPALFYLGAVMYDTGRANDALPHFRRVLSLSPVTEWGASAQAYVDSIQRALGAPPRNWSLSVGTSALYDQNILGVNPSSATSSSSSSGVSAFFLSGGYRPADWFGINYSFNQTLNYASSSYNYQDHLASLYFSYPYSSSLTPAFQYVFDYGFLGGSEYQRQHRLSPNLTWRMAPGWESQFYYAFDTKTFPSFTELSGNAHELGLGTRWSSGAISFGLRYGLHVELANNLTLAGTPANSFFSYSYTGHQISTDFVILTVQEIYLLLGVGYDMRRYHQPDQWLTTDSTGAVVVNNKRREDSFLSFSVGLSRRLLPQLTGTLQYAFNRSGSTLGASDYTDYNYDRQTVSLVLQSDF